MYEYVCLCVKKLVGNSTHMQCVCVCMHLCVCMCVCVCVCVYYGVYSEAAAAASVTVPRDGGVAYGRAV